MSFWWVPDDTEIWVLAKQEGEVQSNGCLKFCVVDTNKIITQNADACVRTVVSSSDVQTVVAPDDMISLPEVNQASILNCIRTRFREKSIYTSVGTVLMTVNPFERINGLYGPEVIRKYLTPFSSNGPLKPHVYLVPSRAFADMSRTGSNQSILISGESGAGKTEATKGCLSFLTAVAEEFSGQSANNNSSSADKVDIAGRIIAASPVLEAFGNAKTVKNPNSSRFGKWMELQFCPRNALQGSIITSYLLEKSRVTRRDPKERNYHIFYQLLRGLNLQKYPDWALQRDTSKYKYLERPGLGEAVDLNDAAEFKETEKAFEVLGFTAAETNSVLKLVAGILHLGNVEFIDQNGGEASAVNTRTDAVVNAARLFSVQADTLGHTLTHRSMVSGTKRSVIVIQLKPELASDTKDSLARAIYDKLFKYIITCINSKASTSQSRKRDGERSIGLLDIFGFEIFPVNSLEQLCINYCNEMLQNHFNFVIFTAEKALYVNEGITCDTIEFKDNIPIIQDIEKLFKALDEEAKLPKGSSKSWYEKLKKAGASNKAANVTYPTRKDIFVVQHYAGSVEYYPTDFLEKNTETLNNDLVECMMTSMDPTLQYLFNPANDEDDAPAAGGASSSGGAGAGGGKKAQRSIAWKFQTQLNSLMTMLRQTQSHFIRCIKSNDECKAMVFDAKNVTRQLLYSGVFEVVKIQQSGLPCRATHRDFLERYKSLAPFNIRYRFRTPQELIDVIKAPPFSIELPHLQCGATMMFFKGLEQRLLESALASWHKRNCIRIQCFRRCHYLRRVYAPMIRWVRLLQTHADNYNATGARTCLGEIKKCITFYEKASRHTNLNRMFAARTALVELTQQRENLIKEATTLANTNTEEALKVIGSVAPRAEKLGISHVPIIQRCAELDTAYQTALKFIKQAATEASLATLSMVDITTGISSLQNFENILAAAPSTLARANKWKTEVEEELATVFEPLLHRFELAAIEFNPETGRMVRVNGSDTEQQLRSFQTSLVPNRFKCKDTLNAYNDSAVFLRLIDEALMTNNGDKALSILSAYAGKASFEVSVEQFKSFESWGTLVSSVQRLTEALKCDYVVAACTGKEPPVRIEALQKHSAPLRAIASPSQDVEKLLNVVDDILTMRQMFLTEQWKALEDFTFTVEAHADEGLFDRYPHCTAELESCIWMTSYHNALSDLLFVIRDPAVSQLPLNASDWAPLLENAEPSQLAIDSAVTFSTRETTPVLEELLPVARLMLEMKHDLFSMKMVFVETAIKKLNEPATVKLINKHQLMPAIAVEVDAARKLMAIISCEEDLNEALKKSQVGIYVCTSNEAKGIGLSRTAQQCNICGSPSQLVTVLDRAKGIVSDESSLPESLLRLYRIGKRVLMGRVAVAQPETDGTYDYDAIIQAISRDDDQIAYVEEIFQTELDNIVFECRRRICMRQLMQVLASRCVVGTKFVDLRIDSTALRDTENLLNAVNTRINTEFSASGAQPPANILHLRNFTMGVMTVRRAFQRCVTMIEWTELYNALSSLQTLLNDDGLAVPGIVEEIESIRATYIAQMELQEMRTSLIDITLVIDERVPLETKQAVVNRISDALFLMNKTPGPEAKQLFELGQLVRIILLKIIDGTAPSIPESKAVEACDGYKAAGLDLDGITLIFKYIRLRHSLKIICDAICTNHTSETITETLDSIKQEMTIPSQLVPWFHCGESYAQLVQALECRDWLIIVNRARYLEELLVPLSALPSVDSENEARLIDLARTRTKEAYKVALAIKAVETELQVTAAVENVPVNEVMKRTIREVDVAAHDGISELRKKGASDQEIVDSGKFPLNQLWAMDVPAALLHAKGYSVLKMRAAGYSCAELLTGGYSVDALGKAGYESHMLRKAGATLDQLRTAGFSDAKILMAGYPVAELKAAGFEAAKLVKIGISPKDLVGAGFTGKELRAAGFTADILRKAGMDRATYLRASGFGLDELLEAGFTVTELRQAGYDFDSLREVGISDELLMEAGFAEELTRETLLDLYDSTDGKNWKIKMHWCTNRPMREWYGITVELLMHESGHPTEQVVGIDLHDNNLCGEIPPSMGLLTSLRTLNLSMNNLHGVIPAELTRLKELTYANLTNNPLLREVGKGGVKRTPRSPITKAVLYGANGNNSSSASSPGTPKQPQQPRGVGANAVNLLGFMKTPPPPPTNRDQKLQDQLTHMGRDNETFGRTEQSVLLELFNTTQGPSWKLKRNWSSIAPLNQWFGLTVSRLDRVVKLVLPMNNLNGPIPSSIDCLTALRELDLRYNQLTGVIPATLSKAKHLTHIHLHCNRLTGTIPESFSEITTLEVLDVRSNQLTGTLPTNLEALTNLQHLAITSNFIKIPSKQAVKNRIPWCRVVIL